MPSPAGSRPQICPQHANSWTSAHREANGTWLARDKTLEEIHDAAHRYISFCPRSHHPSLVRRPVVRHRRAARLSRVRARHHGVDGRLIEGAKRKIWSIATAIVDSNPDADIRMGLV